MSDESSNEASKVDQFVTALKGSLRETLERGRVELNRQTHLGKLRLDALQLGRDRSLLLERLGRELAMMMDRGQLLEQPQLEKPYKMVRDLEQRLAELNAEIERIAQGEAEE